MDERRGPPLENSWFAWANHVLSELERNTGCHGDIKKDLVQIKVAIAELKIKSGMWGAIGGMIPIGLGLIIWLIKGI